MLVSVAKMSQVEATVKTARGHMKHVLHISSCINDEEHEHNMSNTSHPWKSKTRNVSHNEDSLSNFLWHFEFVLLASAVSGQKSWRQHVTSTSVPEWPQQKMQKIFKFIAIRKPKGFCDILMLLLHCMSHLVTSSNNCLDSETYFWYSIGLHV